MMFLSTLLAQAPGAPRAATSTGGSGGLQLGSEPITGAGSVGEQVAQLTDKESATALFTEQLSNIIAFLTVLGGLFFVIYFLIAGFEWLRAGSDTGAVEKAKNRMINAAIGLLVMILTTAIVGIVGGVFGLDLLDPGSVFNSITP
jgi:hypothetical protein